MQRIALFTLMLLLVSATTSGCVMSEEVKRINKIQRERQLKKEQMTTNLSGEQIFVRSCNSCHPGGKAGMGPDLDKLSEHFPKDDQLKQFIRNGVGVMPPQPKEALNDQELDSLVFYLRSMNEKEKDG